MDDLIPDINYVIYLVPLFIGSVVAQFSRFIGVVLMFTTASLFSYTVWDSVLGKIVLIILLISMIGELRRY